MNYESFIDSKRLKVEPCGFDALPSQIMPGLFPFQQAIVRWAIQRGRAAPSPAPGEAIEAIREALGNGAAMGLRACASMAERAQAIQHFGEPSDTWRLQERASRDACDAIETKLRAALASLEGKEAK